MKYGIGFTQLLGPSPSSAEILDCARAAEEWGFHSFVISDHVVAMDYDPASYPAGTFPDDTYWSDPYVVLAAVAGATSTIRLGTGIAVVPYRPAIPQAQAVATLDFISEGRFSFGVGIGWMPEEFEALGVPYSERGRRTNEYLEVMKLLWSGGSQSFAGEFTTFSGARLNPLPAQRPGPPILVGGETPAALRRIARLGDGFCINWKTLPEFTTLLADLEQETVKTGKPMAGLFMQLASTTLEPVRAELDNMNRYEALGLDEIVFMPSTDSPEAGMKLLREIADEFIGGEARRNG